MIGIVCSWGVGKVFSLFVSSFAMQFSLGYVQSAEEVAILTAHEHNHPLDHLTPCATLDDLLELNRAVENVRISYELKRYAVDLAAFTRTAPGVQLGASPRASISLMKAAQALEGIIADLIRHGLIPVFPYFVATVFMEITAKGQLIPTIKAFFLVLLLIVAYLARRLRQVGDIPGLDSDQGHAQLASRRGQDARIVALGRGVRIDQERHPRCAWRQLLQELQTLEVLFDAGQREAGHISGRVRQSSGKPRQRRGGNSTSISRRTRRASSHSSGTTTRSS